MIEQAKKIHIERTLTTSRATLGRITIDGVLFGWTLEPAHHVPKIRGRTRIPAWTYAIELRKQGGMNATYRAKYPRWHKGMLWLKNVNNFKYIYIHIGNFIHETRGCILIGTDFVHTSDGIRLTASKKAYMRFYNAITPPTGMPVGLTVTIRDPI